MRILFTGASSFTGYWFVRELSQAGHDVTAVFRRPPSEYADEPRRQRVSQAAKWCRTAHGCSFGDERFTALIGEGGSWDVLCHHAAEVTDYKSADFNVTAALASNTRNLRPVLDVLWRNGCRRVVLTGSVFEQDEGAGSQGLPAFSPYGLSKALTWQVFRHYVLDRGMGLGKFVISNPFGPLEEPRFTTYLARNWLAGTTPSVSTPAYVRDNIHVTLLARAYRRFVERMHDDARFTSFHPSGYIEAQGAFARRFAAEMSPRLGVPCPLELKPQTQFAEPRVRLNTDSLDAAELGWDEGQAWDGLAEYYRTL